MIEELADTELFHRVRIPLGDFVDFPPAYIVKDGIRRPIAGEHPMRHFRCRHGFYLCTDFFRKFYPHLEPRPSVPNVSHLFLWTLRKNCVWAAAHKSFEGKNQPVPWWVIRPFLAHVSHAASSLVTGQHEMLFFMEAKGSSEESIKELVSLSLHFEMVHTAWWLNLAQSDVKKQCYEGQSFLAVA